MSAGVSEDFEDEGESGAVAFHFGGDADVGCAGVFHCFSACVVPLFVEVVCFRAEAYDGCLSVVADFPDGVDDGVPA